MAAHLVDGFRHSDPRVCLEPAEERSDDAGLDGVPDPDLTPQFQTFLDIFTNPDSYNKGASAIGSADQELMAEFFADWQAGDITDLQGELDATAKQINDQLAQASAP